MKIEQIKIRNYKALKDVEIRDIKNLSVFLGANGSGKSTLFDAIGFLSDSLKHNVKYALTKRGGMIEVISRDQKPPIEFEIKFRNFREDTKKKPPLITYFLQIGEEDNSPIVLKEILSYRRGGGGHGRPWRFLDFSKGKGQAIINEDEYGKEGAQEKREEQFLDSPDILALKGLGQFQKFKAVASFRRLLENWYVSNFHIQASRAVQELTISEHLSSEGENLAAVTQFIYSNHPEIFRKILEKLKKRVPGIEGVTANDTIDGRIVLKFKDGSFKDPFIARYVSDGTLKMFAYLILLHDPVPYPLLCIEEPENFLHPALMYQLAEEFREYANNGGQVFISTHSPEFVNALNIEEVYWLTKESGFSKIKKASETEIVGKMVQEGEPLGQLWKQGYLKGSNPIENH